LSAPNASDTQHAEHRGGYDYRFHFVTPSIFIVLPYTAGNFGMRQSTTPCVAMLRPVVYDVMQRELLQHDRPMRGDNA
jgi:hypothetical protein